MSVPNNLLYTEDHEWILVDGDEATIGITDYAQGELGDIVLVESVGVGTHFEKGDSLGSIEAVKATADVYAPLSGEILDINSALEDDPQLINHDPFEGGWIVRVRISNKAELDDLMSPDEYDEQVSD
ncbi:MAG: glycine cleavage system protein GcvH [Calditrichaeota bacterium]|nr:glycine cleavage system protein GcvH [Candidatus Cloacimonadota bacterium]MCA9785053.1 glycine cleavage system protein GcvH [Candidatus Cloacimonadota bacterium]MCB1047999.1 glycine cleavage system protein GcvH [Calditrichota bacterium]MCB9474759.1 glycine cleavage system protein GcvH [Candidatus Delongbacteria bacterium]